MSDDETAEAEAERLPPGAPEPDRLYIDPDWWISDGRLTTRELMRDLDDYTRHDLADDSGIAPGTLHNFLEGLQVPTLERAKAIEQALDHHLWEYQSVYDEDIEDLAAPYREIDLPIAAKYNPDD